MAMAVKTKAELVALHKERLTLLEMTKVIQSNGYKVKNFYGDSPASLRALCSRLHTIRNDVKPIVSPKTFAERYAAGNVQLFKKYVAERRFAYEIECGKRCGAKWEKSRYSKGDAHFYIGYMWRRNVWKRFVQNKSMVTDNILIIRAEEYKINVDHIRLYEATVFDLKEKKEVNGYIGQSKLGGKAVFKKERNLAIAGAIALARKNVSEKLLGETE
jgi:hypothetical protein